MSSLAHSDTSFNEGEIKNKYIKLTLSYKYETNLMTIKIIIALIASLHIHYVTHVIL